jgi:hypothetical protein
MEISRSPPSKRGFRVKGRFGTLLILGLSTLALTFAPSIAAAQSQAAEGRLVITVVDTTAAVIQGATVTVAGVDEATKNVAPATVQTTDKGVAFAPGLRLGRYSVRAEFPGFEPGLLKEVRVRAGDNRHVIVLALQKMQDTVTVGRDAQTSASDRRGPAFGSALTREQIEALSDDPEEMAQQLRDMGGLDAVIRVDSFEGGRLPPKSQIKAIHITRDAFAAENHSAGALFIDIITQPGMGPLRAGTNYRLRDGSMSGRNPLTNAKAPERTQNFGLNVGGSLIKGKSSFSLNVNGMKSFETPYSSIGSPNGTKRSQTLNLTRPRDQVFFNGLFDYALTPDQTLRMGFNREQSSARNLGVGEFDELERAYSTKDSGNTFRMQEAGPLGRRFFINTRLQVGWNDSESTSVLEAPTIRVLDWFTSGGQQIAGGRHTRRVNLASDLDYVRGMHSLRGGIVLDGAWYRSDDSSNYLGTYTFESNEDFLAGRARNYTRRIGDPNIKYGNLQTGIYIQDDIRVRRGLTLSPGLRYELQTHIHEYGNIGPRFGLTWAPWKSGKTTLRTSWGIFYDWLNTGTYEQTLRVDGFRQRELNIVNPSYPDPGTSGIIPTTNVYLLGDDIRMVKTNRASLGIDRAFTPRIRGSVSYAYMRGAGLLRGNNLNTPVNGVRPDPVFGNIVEVVPDARSRSHSIGTNLTLSLTTPGPTTGLAKWNWKRLNFNAGYNYGKSENNTEGAFNVPATGSLAAEWGPSNNDVRHRVFTSFNSQALRGFNANINLSAFSASPYTIRTGRDDNADSIFNDRPVGTGRNTLRGSGQFNANANFNYMIPLGRRTIAAPPGIQIIGGGIGGPIVSTFANPDAARYRLNIFVQIQNLTNHKNYGGYSGVMTSDFFRQPTTVTGTRKVDVGMGFSF